MGKALQNALPNAPVAMIRSSFSQIPFQVSRSCNVSPTNHYVVTTTTHIISVAPDTTMALSKEW